MAREAGLTVARGASTWLVRVYLGRDPQTVARSTTTSPFTVRFAKRSAFSISGFSNGITPRVSRGCPESEPVARSVAFNCSQGLSQDENVPGIRSQTRERYLEA
jgi:hypothetical protein